MSVIPPSNAASGFLSLTALRAAHATLIEGRRASGDTPELLARIFAFIQQGVATGVLLDAEADRRAAQGLLDYWANVLDRHSYEPPEPTLAEFDPQLAPTLADALCPYLGLDAFREDDQVRFFGRQRLVAVMLNILEKKRMLAVVGPSGSGKSSLVRAGLIPALKGGALAGSESWHYLSPIVPGSDPLTTLDRVLTNAAQTLDHEEPLTVGNSSLISEFQSLTPVPIFLVVDQFEEIFTLCHDVDVREAFIGRLLALVQSPTARYTVILTMRVEYESSITLVQELQEPFEQGRVQVTPLNASELREAIEKPAEAIGLKFESGLVDTLLQDILGEPAALPLLQFTLLTLWDNRNHNRVTWDAYKRIGGGRLALANIADQFYKALIPEDQVAVRRLLLRIVSPNDGLEVTSNRVRLAELYRGGEASERIDRVLQRLIDARLVRLTPGDTPEDAQVEVAHEALIRNWPRLVEWLEESREALRQRRRLEAKATDWVRLGSGSGGLLDDVQLRETERWIASQDATIGYASTLDALVAASRAALEHAERKREAARQHELDQARALAQAQQRELDQARALARVRKRLSLVLVVALIGALLVAGYALALRGRAQQAATAAQMARAMAEVSANERATAQVLAQQQAEVAQTAEAQARTANQTLGIQAQTVDSQRLAFAAQSQQAAPQTALLLAYEAAKRSENQVTDRALRDAINQSSWTHALSLTHTGGVVSAVFSADRQGILTASKDNTARLWDANGQLLATLQGHSRPINSAVFSPDEQRILTASQDNTARLWDTNGQSLIELRGHTNFVSSAVFSPDGQRILTASWDNTARIWALDGTLLATLQGHTGLLYNAVFSADGQRILTASNDGTARVWDAQGVLLTTLQGHTGSVRSAVFSADGQRILTASGDKTVRLWDGAGNLLATLQGHTDQVNSAVFSPDGQRILTASQDHTARLWTSDGNWLATLQGHTDQVNSAVFSADGQRILTASRDYTARVWDTAGKLLATLQSHTDQVNSAVFSVDGQHILTASEDKQAELWNFEQQPLATLQNHIDVIVGAVFSPDGQRILTASNDQTAKLWSNTGALIASLQGHRAAVTSALFSPDGQFILTASLDNTTRLWDATGKLRVTLQGHTGPVNTARFSSDGTRLLTASDDTTARIWDLQGQLLAVLQGHNGPVLSAVFSPNDQYVLTASWDGTARVWDITGRLLVTLQGHTSPVNTAVFSPDGQHMLTASWDGTARVWDTTGQLLATLQGHTDVVNGAVFSPDGQFILTAARDNTARLWDAKGKLLTVLQSHTGPINSAVFSPDGQRLLTASDDTTVQMWDRKGELFATLQDHRNAVLQAVFSSDGRRILTASADRTARQYLVYVDDLLNVAACRVDHELTPEELKRFDVGTPRFSFAKRQCPPVLPGQ